MYVRPDCTSAQFVRCGRNRNYVLTVDTLVSRNINAAMVTSMVGP